MYLGFYGLTKQPFGATPDPGYVYLGSSHCEAIASILYGIERNLGFMALVAEPGMGKTTLIMRLMKRLEGSARTACLFQVPQTSEEFIAQVAANLGCEVKDGTPSSLRAVLNRVLLQEAKENRRVVVFVDEAENLSDSMLEAVLQLSKPEVPSSNPVQIVFSGRPQLTETLARPSMVQLSLRISMYTRLNGLTPWEVGEYIRHRLRRSGGDGRSVFTSEALDLIARTSQGIPGSINQICLNALSLGRARQRKLVDTSILRETLSDFPLVKAPLLREKPADLSSSRFALPAQSR